MKKIYYIIMALTGIWVTFLISCTEAPLGQTATDKIPPSPLMNVQVESYPGGAKIIYDFPDETDISYVKGEFMFQGAKKVVRASVYDNFLLVDGLPSVDPVEITLTLVDHSENSSEPVVKTFTPDKPPHESIFESIIMSRDWGGVKLNWDNPLGIEIRITFFVADSTGSFGNSRVWYSTAKVGEYSFRGYNSVEQKFGVQITDKWGNVSGVKDTVIVPLFEKMLNKSLIKRRALPWDNTSSQGGQNFEFMFDGNKLATGNLSWHTQENQDPAAMGFTTPVLFTIDLGVDAILNRLLWWQGRWADYFLYGHHNPRTFEVWGTMEIPSGKPDVYWREDWKQDWTLIADCEVIKPSRTPLGELTNEDRAQADAGHEFYLQNVKVRYLRFSVTSTWIGDKDNTVTIHEIEPWGNDGSND
ncbi:MAG: DUF4959 domain-containing protein [Prevotellaceae bacterium]|jgi:hypothetical protein|nr:DUF4959 domain-containing protein [Prevotellaceae bacterium]